MCEHIVCGLYSYADSLQPRPQQDQMAGCMDLQRGCWLGRSLCLHRSSILLRRPRSGKVLPGFCRSSVLSRRILLPLYVL